MMPGGGAPFDFSALQSALNVSLVHMHVHTEALQWPLT